MNTNIRTLLITTLAAAALQLGCSSSGDGAPDQFRVKMETSKGNVIIEVNKEWAPLGTDRFHELVKLGYYDGNRFFRVLPGFVAQFGMHGDPAITAKWSESRLSDDPPGQSNVRGTVTFATSGPNTRTTQLFINLADNVNLDQQGFTPFGKVVEGMNVVDQFFKGYGEGGPNGGGPEQGLIRMQGNAYLQSKFPLLDYVKKATIEQ